MSEPGPDDTTAGAVGPLLHLALPEDWTAAFASGVYEMSTRGRTLAEEGFIHCSRPHQVEGVANRFYADVDELIVLTIDEGRVGALVRDEPPAPGVDELFPHLYGPLPVAAVSNATFWSRSSADWSLDDLSFVR